MINSKEVEILGINIDRKLSFINISKVFPRKPTKN